MDRGKRVYRELMRDARGSVFGDDRFYSENA